MSGSGMSKKTRAPSPEGETYAKKMRRETAFVNDIEKEIDAAGDSDIAAIAKVISAGHVDAAAAVIKGEAAFKIASVEIALANARKINDFVRKKVAEDEARDAPQPQQAQDGDSTKATREEVANGLDTLVGAKPDQPELDGDDSKSTKEVESRMKDEIVEAIIDGSLSVVAAGSVGNVAKE